MPRNIEYLPVARHGILAVTLALIASVSSAQGKPAVNSAPPRIPPDLKGLKIRLIRTSCFGSCPVYSIAIDGDGTVTYEGRGFVRIKGKRLGYAATADVRRLANLFISAGYFSFRRSYGEAGSDLPSAITSIEWPGVQKTVTNYGGFEGKIPTRLFEIEGAIDVTANSQQWIGADKERMKK